MAKDSNELRFVLPLIGGCLIAIIGFHWAYWPEFKVLLHDGFFQVLYIAGMLGFLFFSFWIYVKRDAGNPNPLRVVTLLVAAFVCIWIGTWCSQYRTDKSDKIEYKYGK